jgi:hypothetical protein
MLYNKVCVRDSTLKDIVTPFGLVEIYGYLGEM